MNPADAIYAAYLREARRPLPSFARASSGFAQARHVSKCHGAATITGRRGQQLCAQCRQPCDLSWLEVRRNHTRRSEPWEHDRSQRVEVEPMRVRESRSVDRSRSDRALVASLSALLLLRRLVAPRPRALTAERWSFVRRAWALYLDFGVPGAVRTGQRCYGGRHQWTEWRVREAVEQGREVVLSRLHREPETVRAEVARVAGVEVVA